MSRRRSSLEYYFGVIAGRKLMINHQQHNPDAVVPEERLAATYREWFEQSGAITSEVTV
ncbi:MAG: hypothetical protein OXM87_11215 [Truepera sp.]|nr:hypothetical protein [Truepera sp.]